MTFLNDLQTFQDALPLAAMTTFWLPRHLEGGSGNVERVGSSYSRDLSSNPWSDTHWLCDLKEASSLTQPQFLNLYNGSEDL